MFNRQERSSDSQSIELERVGNIRTNSFDIQARVSTFSQLGNMILQALPQCQRCIGGSTINYFIVALDQLGTSEENALMVAKSISTYCFTMQYMFARIDIRKTVICFLESSTTTVLHYLDRLTCSFKVSQVQQTLFDILRCSTLLGLGFSDVFGNLFEMFRGTLIRACSRVLSCIWTSSDCTDITRGLSTVAVLLWYLARGKHANLSARMQWSRSLQYLDYKTAGSFMLVQEYQALCELESCISFNKLNTLFHSFVFWNGTRHVLLLTGTYLELIECPFAGCGTTQLKHNRSRLELSELEFVLYSQSSEYVVIALCQDKAEYRRLLRFDLYGHARLFAAKMKDVVLVSGMDIPITAMRSVYYLSNHLSCFLEDILPQKDILCNSVELHIAGLRSSGILRSICWKASPCLQFIPTVNARGSLKTIDLAGLASVERMHTSIHIRLPHVQAQFEFRSLSSCVEWFLYLRNQID